MDWHNGLVLTWHCMVVSSSLGENLNLTLYFFFFANARVWWNGKG